VSDDPSAVARARALVRDAERIVVLTGAGVSAESGVQTFRGDGGLWRSYRPEELATPQAFARDPRVVWEWYTWRRSLVAACEPNAAHTALARLALSGPAPTTLVTQNVDGLHHRAADAVATGGDAERGYPLEVHGALHRDRCARCQRRSDGIASDDLDPDGPLPACSACGGPLRPDVVWFGEALDPEVIGAAFDAAASADLCIVVGTSALVHPAASIPDATLRSGGSLLEINLEPTPLSRRSTLTILGEAGSLVPAVLESAS
jgi:NAD-dependent deacetylase